MGADECVSSANVERPSEKQNSHHDLPRVHGQICVVEGPIELLLGDRLIGGIVVR